MSAELHRLILRAGGTLVRVGRRHRYYDLQGVRITLHMGGRLCHGLDKKIRSQCAAALRRKSCTRTS